MENTENEKMETLENGKKTKESAEYNVIEMSFICGGVKRVYTWDKEITKTLSETTKKLILLGCRNTIIDSVASLTLKNGFTNEMRATKMTDVMNGLNMGKTVVREKSEKIPAVKMSDLNKITDVLQLMALREAIAIGVLPNVKLTAKQLEILALEDGENGHE